MKKSASVGTSSAQKPAKKQKLGGGSGFSGGLLKFGFTGVKGEPSPSPVSIEYSQCPLCSGLFNTMAIVEHAATCSGEERASSASDILETSQDLSQGTCTTDNQRKTNAFDLMRKSAALKPVTTAPSIMHFALILKEDKLLPVFSASGDYVEQLYTQCKISTDQPPNWASEANVKKFRWHFDHSTPSHRDIRLHISTNIPPDTVSFADTAPISTAWLKSMLQKAVRRKLAFKAVKLANMMCRTNPTSTGQNKSVGSPVGSPVKSRPASQTNNKSNTNTNNTTKPTNTNTTTKPANTNTNNTNKTNTTLLSELLRRLPIICVEDAALHPSYPLLVWLMVAVSKGYNPPKYLLHVVLLITHDIAVCTYKDCIPPYEYDLCATDTSKNGSSADSTSSTAATAGSTTATNTTNTDTDTNTNTSTTLHTWEGIENDSVRTLLACICIRASFGGMVGDMQMLDKFAQLWYVRLLCGDMVCNEFGSGGSGGVVGGNSGGGSGGCKGIVPDSISCYLHSSYTNAFIQPVGNGSGSGSGSGSGTSSGGGWASQLYDNFQPGSIVMDTPAVCEESTTLASSVERVLTTICTHYACNTTYNATSITRPTATLPTLLKITLSDLVPEGLDQHCDYSLLPSILNTCNDKVQQLSLQPHSDSIVSTLAILKDPHLEANIKSAIWLFRSANNSRKLYPYLVNNTHNDVNKCISVYYQELVDSDLAQKAKLARLWGIVCPMIVAFCDRKMVTLSHRL